MTAIPHKTWQIRLTAVPPQSPAHQTDAAYCMLSVWCVRL